MLNVDIRPAMLGPTINDRTEIHGDENVPAMDITVSDIMLTIPELAALLRVPVKRTEALFDRDKHPIEPAFQALAPLQLGERISDVDVLMLLGLDEYELDLPGCTVRVKSLVPMTGGLTAMECRIQYAGQLNGNQLERLRGAKGREISIGFAGGKVAERKATKQPELALDHGAEEAEGDADNEADEETEAAEQPKRNGHRRSAEAAAH